MSQAANVDPQEISKFADQAHLWWDETSEFKPLHQINPLRLGYVDKYANIKGKKVADIGCGGGILSESMAKTGADVTGIDLAEASLNVAELHALEAGLDIDYQFISAEDFSEQNTESYDVVTCLEMLEHVPDPASIVKSAAKACKPGGYVFFSTINRNSKSWVMAIAGAEYILGLIPKGTHEFKRFIKPSELASFARAQGLEIIDLTGMTYNPLTAKYKLFDNIDVNYLMACRKIS